MPPPPPSSGGAAGSSSVPNKRRGTGIWPCGTIPGCVTARASGCQETSPDREMLPLPWMATRRGGWGRAWTRGMEKCWEKHKG